MNNKAFDILKERGYVYQATDETRIKELLNSEEKQTFYLGIDPTADSLHIGHFFALTMVRRLQEMGHHPIIIVGGATALIGDPTGKKDLRKILTKEQVAYNKVEVKQLIERFVKIDGENPAIILDNSDWINKESYIDFMRNVGVYFNVNRMLATDCYQKRLEEGGLTFLEMGYMLMQAYDFIYLNEKYNCTLQIGGSDQWANMVAGVELGRKIDSAEGKNHGELQAFTCPLLVKADGEKMGKTASGTLWVSREKTTVYDFYQMFINSYDEDVERLLSFFSDYEISEIKEMCENDIRKAKKLMAFEVTKLVHGEEEALKIEKASEDIFANKGDSDSAETFEVEQKDITKGILLVDLLLNSRLVTSKSEARRLIQQNGIRLNNEKETDVNKEITLKDFNDHSLIIRKGKKQFKKVIIK